jgi:hypothetical protein
LGHKRCLMPITISPPINAIAPVTIRTAITGETFANKVISVYMPCGRVLHTLCRALLGRSLLLIRSENAHRAN